MNQVEDISADQRRAAARKLIGFYEDLQDDPPDHLLSIARRGLVQPEMESRTTAQPIELRSVAIG